MSEAVQLPIPAKLAPLFTAINKRYRCSHGGRGSAKTRTFALMTAVKAYQAMMNGESGVILCAREFMNSLEESSMQEVKQAILSVPWLASNFDIGEKYIRTIDKTVTYVFAGLRHNLDSIKSKARILLCWVDEAESVSEIAWQKLSPTVREEGSEIWVTWNPERDGSATDKRFRKEAGDDCITVEMNFTDNPWFPDVLEGERLNDQRRLDPATYAWVWEGAYLENSDKQVLAGKYRIRYDFYGLDAGSYTLGVRGRNENGMKGAETQVSLVIGAPGAPTFIQWTPGIFSADIVPVMNVTATTDTSFEFWYTGEVPASSVGAVEDEAQFLGRASQWTLHGLKADTTYYMYVRTKNAFGVSPFVQVSGKASSDIPGMIDLIDDAIRDSEAFENLTSNINTNIEGMLQNALNNNSSVDHQFAINGEVRADIIVVRTTIATVSLAMAEFETQVQAQLGDLTAAVNEKLTAVVQDDGTAKAFYTLQLGIKRADQFYSSGMAIGIEPSGSTYKSTVAFNADQFGIYTGSEAGNYQLAFAAVNGQVFINSAFIQDASITNAKIGEFIQSVNYVSGTTGWSLNKNGVFENNGYEPGNGRMVQTNNQISVYDGNGVLRVRMGKLS